MNKIEHIEAFKIRTKQFAIRIIKLFQNLPKTDDARIIGNQLLRSATSTAACRARSDAEFFSKIFIVLEEADETLFWIEILTESEIMNEERLKPLYLEAEEIVKIVNTIRYNRKSK